MPQLLGPQLLGPQLQCLRVAAAEACVLWNLFSATREATTMRSPQRAAKPHLLQLEKAPVYQGRLSAAKKKQKNGWVSTRWGTALNA